MLDNKNTGKHQLKDILAISLLKSKKKYYIIKTIYL